MAKTVLIVEDNELNMKLFHDLLDAHGYRTLQTRNGMDALKLAREHRPDLILMDIQLPEVSGLEVTKWLKEDDELRDIPGDRRHRLRHEGRRGAHPPGRLRGLHLQADLGRARFSTRCAGISARHESTPWLVARCRRCLMTARVLVVDDILANVKLLEARLSAEYFEVLTAYSGRRRSTCSRPSASTSSCSTS